MRRCLQLIATIAGNACLIPSALALDAIVTFNEVMYHPLDGEPEWIELHNMMSVDVDLSDWQLTGGIDYVFPVTTVIRGGGYLVVEGLGEPPSGALGPFSGRLDNAGEEIRLRNNSGRIMDELDYGDSGRWPVAADGSGASLAKRTPRLASGQPENWTFSRQSGGTPGAANLDEPPAMPSLQISEITAANAVQFWVELLNAGAEAVDSSGFLLVNPASGDGGAFQPAAQPLAPGARLVIDEATLGFRVADEGRLFLTSADGAVIHDAVRVKNRPLARLPGAAAGDRFFTPSTPTPGAPNAFAFRDEIVINEIMYHHRPQPARDAQTGGFESLPLLAWSDAWRYNQSGADLGADWAQAAHPAGGDWQSGPGLLGFDLGGSFPEPILTPVTWPALNDPFVITYYFEREFDLTPEQFDRLEEVHVRHLVDDGAVFYVNGVEAGRFCMPAGAVDAATLADCPPENDATLQGPLVIPKSRFAPGTNRLSVEVHQAEVGSSDVVFGLDLTAILVADGGTPSQEFAKIDDEWIELHNRSGAPVDLTGWTLDGGIAYEFDPQTTIDPGGYLVVARDAASLAAKHPSARVVGDFSGRLGNGSDYLKLEDAAKNPVDEVHYHDGGRWPSGADGDGSSLELRDPRADNAIPEAWAASDESARGTWQTFRYRARAQAFPGTNDPTTYNEFLFGLLDAGEFLIDDLSVVEDPDGTARELIQNGSFETDALGNSPARWRLLGTHGLHGRSVVVPDPDGGDQVLHVVATGPMWHTQNQAETTLRAGNQYVTINSARDYEISFRARWLTGSPLLNTRLYFNRVAKTHVLPLPAVSGTPGAENSARVANLGPALDAFRHAPLRPAAGEPVTVSAAVADPDGVASVTLHWSTNGSTYSEVPMTPAADGRYEGSIPGQSSNTRVQIYLEARDQLDAAATFPAAGRNSRALFRVGNVAGPTNRAQHLEIVMLPGDEALMARDINLMSNHRFGATVIYEDEVFYDVGVRLKGSQRGRPDLNRRGFNVDFHADQKFRGVLDSIGLDRSGGWRFGRTFGQDEILIWHFINRAGGIPALHNDIVHLDAPGVADGSAQLQLARFSNEFLRSQFDEGEDGSIHNYELIYYPTTTTGGVEGIKRPNPDNVTGVPIRSLGADKEAYRYYFQLRNNEERDDYAGVMALAGLFSLGTPALLAAAPDVIDIDQWLRAYAAVSLAAVSDSYFNNSNAHNARFYQRPSDGRVLLFPWDMDFAFINGATSSLTPNSDLVRLLGDPVNRRLFWGHVQDLVTRSYNAGYMRRWVEHYEDFLTGQDLTPITDFIAQRASYALGQVQSAIPRVSFSITTNGGSDFDSPVTPVVLEGDAWVDVRELRLAGSPVALPVTWTDANSWRVSIPLGPGANNLTLEAVDFAGELITTDAITVTNTSSTVAAAANNLALTELMYHPTDPTADELAAGFTDPVDFEFCEFQNIGASPVDLGGVTFASGIAFTVPSGVTVAPGQRVLIVRNPAAFHARYGTLPGATIAGSYQDSGTAFSNSGERVHVLAADGSTIVDFTYGDSAPWPADADGSGYSLVPIAPEHALHDPSLPIYWRTSSAPGGNPGSTDATSFSSWSAANGHVAPLDDPESDRIVALIEYATGRFPHLSESQPAVLLDPADPAAFSFVLALGADDVAFAAELSTDLATWAADGLTYTGSRNNHDGTRTVTFTHDAPSPARFARLRFDLRE